MTIIVRDDGFHPDDGPDFVEIGAADAAPDTLPDPLSGTAAIRIRVAAFSDGRAFTLARRLRLRGFAGRLRLAGPVIADQYAMARRAGFDEVEIPDDLAARQPADQWLARANWRDHDYRSRLGMRG